MKRQRRRQQTGHQRHPASKSCFVVESFAVEGTLRSEQERSPEERNSDERRLPQVKEQVGDGFHGWSDGSSGVDDGGGGFHFEGMLQEDDCVCCLPS